MNCLDIQLRLAAGEPDRSDPAVQAHVGLCENCRAALDRELRLDRVLTLTRSERPDARFEDRLVARLRADIADTRPHPLFWTPARAWTAGLSAVAALLLITMAPLRPGDSFGPETFSLAGADDSTRQPADRWDSNTTVHPIFGSSAGAIPDSSRLFASALGGDSAPEAFTGLTLREQLPESSLMLASTNLPLRLGPGNIRYGGNSFMVNFGESN
ncbi:MAG: hypothetical protein KBA51_00740 [Kiritimatiellae bacterium]|nr:hypothetical protein [Kiritimatiellia bacterium]